MGANKCAIDKEVMEVTLKPDNYHPQKFRGLLTPTQDVSVTRLSPAFRVRVWLRETTNSPCGDFSVAVKLVVFTELVIRLHTDCV